MTRLTGIVVFLVLSLAASAQGDQQVRAKADGLFDEKNYIDALPLYSQLVSLTPSDRVLNYRFGTCMLFGGEDKDKAIGHLKFATQDPSIPADAWYWLGRAYHLNYQFKEAQAAYQRYQGTGSKKELEGFTVAALDKQCRNGQNLLSNLKEITVRNKVEVDDTEFFRFYELGDIGGKIVVLPEELKSSLDKKSKQRTLVYIPAKGGSAIYFGSYGKDGKTGRDIYRTELTTDGKFAPPLKLAGYVNTDQDEDFAFLHPDGRSFYFSSKGHNSMGGYDVFRSAYDKGLDAFGPPENLDFAVNTPDDDVFYMTDGENKEACFASGRDSKQGKLHVYRVSTAQVPVVITVLKGTYASVFDKEDRKAHIVVEDAITHEKVADVRTDINGSYVLSIPRSGQFKYAVECGPSGKTHTGTIDVPRATSARAYRQELELTRSGDLEKLVIRNYFEEPLEEDMIALMMEEIKRRAKLDVSTGPEPVAQQPVVEDPSKADPLTKAGFAGDVTEAQAVNMAKQDAAELDRLAYDLDVQSKEAFGIAVQAVTEAERTAREAETLVNAASQETEEAPKNAKMVEAAKLRQRSREANLRARAAFRTGQELEAEELTVQQRAATASKLATDLEGAVNTKKADATLTHLQALKARLDTKAGPDGDLSMAERSRRSLGDQEKDAARLLNVANAKRAEENEFADRIARSKRERDETKSKGRKEELSREITQQEQQLAYLHDEVEGAFTKAREQERATAVYRGQHSLTAHLSTATEHGTGTDLNREQMSGLGQRIAGNDSRIASIPIDERYDAQVVENDQVAEARSFNWGVGATSNDATAASVATQALKRDGSNDAQQAGSRTIAAPGTELAQGELRSATVPVITNERAEDLASAGGAVGQPLQDGPGTNLSDAAAVEPGTSPQGSVSGGANTTSDPANTASANSGAADPDQVGTPSGSSNDAQSATADVPDGAAGATRTTGDGALTGTTRTDVSNASSDTRTATNEVRGSSAANGGSTIVEGSVNGTSGSDTAGSPTTVTTGSTEGSSTDAAQEPTTPVAVSTNTVTDGGSQDPATMAVDAVASPNEDGLNTSSDALDTFVLENDKAELQQAIAAEKNKVRRDSLQAQLARVDQRIAAQRQQVIAQQEAQDERSAELSTEGVDLERIPATFFPDTKEADIITLVYPGYEVDKARVQGIDDAQARADGLSGLELMLADSLRGELVRQAAVLELAPQQGEHVLPKMERLRMIRQQHVQEAERIIKAHEAELAQRSEQEAPVEPLATRAQRSSYARGEDPVADRFVSVEPDAQEVYASKLEHRSSKVDDAVAFKDADLARMTDLDQRIDSIERSMDGLERKEYDKQRREADKLIDERMIIRADLGQRSAFLTKEEWRTANDSIKNIDKRLTGVGLAPDESLLLMAQNMQAHAKTRFAEAEALRKKADRSEDILLRDSLFRNAYATELEALGELDKAITVKTYLLGSDFQRGETLAYDEVARRVLHIVDEPLLAQERTVERTAVNATEPEPTTGERTAVTEAAPAVEVVSRERVTDANEAVDAAAGTTTEAAVAETAIPDNDRTPTPASATSAPAGTGVMAMPNNAAGNTELARRQAEELADRAVAATPSNSRLPVERYENFLQAENVILQQEALNPEMDPQLLAVKAERAVENSAALEQRSLELSDRATALEDSATTARKRDQEKLNILAARARAESDSLHGASLAMAEEARALEMQKRDAEQAKTLRDRLVKYYYLTNEEQAFVLDNPDESRYFQARARALEQYDAAAEAGSSARINRELSEVLRKEADATRVEVEAGRMTNDEGAVKREVLYARAEALSARADSLSNIAARLRGAASINESQASVMLQGQPADRSTEWMALEMRTRRTEPLLADTREPARPVAAPVRSTNDAGARGNASGSTADNGIVNDRSATSGSAVAGGGTSDVADGTNGVGNDQRTAGNNDAPARNTANGSDRTAPTAQPVRNIAAPFGTDNASATPARPRPIVEVAPMPSIPVELVNDIFVLKPTGADVPAAPIAMDARMPNGVVFKVQIGAFRHEIKEEVFSDMTPVMGEHTDKGFIRYTAGLFTGFDQAAKAKDKVRDRGYRDAFVVAYRDGVRIPLGVAMREARAEALAAGNTPSDNTTGVANTLLSTTAGSSTATTTVEPVTAARPVERTTVNTVLEPVRSDVPGTQPAAGRPVEAMVAAPIVLPVAQPLTNEQILAKYPATAEAIVEQFAAQPEAAAYYNVPGAAPADQVELIKGLFYTVQVGVYSKPVPLGKLFNITPLNSERTETAKVRYTTGRYMDTDQARTRKDQAVALGVKDAFVTAYLNGKRIPMQEAAALLQRFGPAILAKP
ncbi:MAG: hypothetical protein JNM62_14605 [Flavobacteriales bacterium]|nr:hypothetical protein [Flavobacteriales bacterium]